MRRKMEYLFELVSKFLKYFIIVQIFTFTIAHDFNQISRFKNCNSSGVFEPRENKG